MEIIMATLVTRPYHREALVVLHMATAVSRNRDHQHLVFALY